jgi:hypothetical protein
MHIRLAGIRNPRPVPDLQSSCCCPMEPWAAASHELSAPAKTCASVPQRGAPASNAPTPKRMPDACPHTLGRSRGATYLLVWCVDVYALPPATGRDSQCVQAWVSASTGFPEQPPPRRAAGGGQRAAARRALERARDCSALSASLGRRARAGPCVAGHRLRMRFSRSRHRSTMARSSTVTCALIPSGVTLRTWRAARRTPASLAADWATTTARRPHLGPDRGTCLKNRGHGPVLEPPGLGLANYSVGVQPQRWSRRRRSWPQRPRAASC